MPDVYAAMRFSRADAPALRAIAELLSVDRPEDDRGVFHRAADSAERDEPLLVRASSQDELERIADRFPRYGITRPPIDPLTK